MAKGQGLVAIGILLASWGLMRANFLLGSGPISRDSASVADKNIRKVDESRLGDVVPIPQNSPATDRSRLVFKRPRTAVSLTPPAPNHPSPSRARSGDAMAPQAFFTEQEPATVALPALEAIQPTVTAAPLLGRGIQSKVSRSTTPSASGWLLIRNGAAPRPLASAGQLGGSQIGSRLLWPVTGLGERTLVSASIRASAAFKDRRNEVAAGVSIKHDFRWPVEMIVERRFGADRSTPDRWAAFAVTGIDSEPLSGTMKFDLYAQAGVVGFRRPQFFAGGHAVVHRKLTAFGKADLHIGLGAWGDIQPGLSRIDLGPDVSLRVRNETLPLRVGLQWRQRVVGNADPRSGPALVVGADF